MDRDGIIPDVLEKAPEEALEIIYPSNAVVDMGNNLTPTQVKDIPTVKWKLGRAGTNEDTLYTLAMVDPDAPSRAEPKFREWHHWLVVNIPGNDIDAGQILSEYVGAGPPEGTDFHRYIFLLYMQPTRLECDEPLLNKHSGKNRANFKIGNFASKYNLGDPIAGNFFHAKFDSYVSELYKQLSSGKK